MEDFFVTARGISNGKRKRLITYGSGDVQREPKKSKPKDNRVIPDPIDVAAHDRSLGNTAAVTHFLLSLAGYGRCWRRALSAKGYL